MDDILAVSLNKTYKEGLSEKDLEDITRQAWRIDNKKVGNIKYIVGIKNKEIKSVYKIKRYEPIKYRFYVEKADSNMEKAIRNTFNNTVSFRPSGDIRYLNSEDLK